MIIQWNSGVQQLAQGYGLSVWNWVGQGGASSADGQVCFAFSIRPTVNGSMSVRGSVNGEASTRGTVAGSVTIAEC